MLTFVIRTVQNVKLTHITFLAVQNSSIGLIVRPLVGPSVTTNNQSLLNTTESTLSLVTFETFVKSDEKT